MSVLTWPLPGYAVTRGCDEHVAFGEEPAVDLSGAGVLGQPALALYDGIVTLAGDLGQCGTACDHEFDYAGHHWHARYCHLGRLDVQSGQSVAAGQTLGLVGWSGWVIPAGPAGAHLHIALWIDGQRVCPESWLALISHGGIIVPPDDDGGDSGGGAPVVPGFRGDGPGADPDGSGGVQPEPPTLGGTMRTPEQQTLIDAARVLAERLKRYGAELDTLQHHNYSDGCDASGNDAEALAVALEQEWPEVTP